MLMMYNHATSFETKSFYPFSFFLKKSKSFTSYGFYGEEIRIGNNPGFLTFMTTSALRVSRYQMTLHTIGKDFSFFIDDACSILEYRARYKLHYIELVKIFFFSHDNI